MSLYAQLFAACDVSVSQFLVTSYDFTDEGRKAHVRYSMEQIISHGMVLYRSGR
jgi:glutamate 5-kinase